MLIHPHEARTLRSAAGHGIAIGDERATGARTMAHRAGLSFAIVAGLCGLLAGCENSVSYTPIIHPSHPLSPRSVNSVEVFAVTPPSRPHRDIGIFQVAGGIGDEGTPSGMVADARATAAQLGCDAILVTSVDVLASRYHPANIQASCIIYDPQPPPPQPPPPPRP